MTTLPTDKVLVVGGKLSVGTKIEIECRVENGLVDVVVRLKPASALRDPQKWIEIPFESFGRSYLKQVKFDFDFVYDELFRKSDPNNNVLLEYAVLQSMRIIKIDVSKHRKKKSEKNDPDGYRLICGLHLKTSDIVFGVTRDVANDFFFIPAEFNEHFKEIFYKIFTEPLEQAIRE